MNEMKKILLIGTGGTIASDVTDSGLAPELTTEQLLSHIPGISDICGVDCLQLLTQAAGEYEQKLKDAGLDLVTRQPETAVTILADGRRLWRVFDNLMNNICKYAQRGTRVYLTLEERDGQAVISFKNTSRAPLDIPAEELLERFVRGDAARGGEGNGLGLSIARSLTELQKGTLELTVDGDLFKVVLRFSELS